MNKIAKNISSKSKSDKQINQLPKLEAVKTMTDHSHIAELVRIASDKATLKMIEEEAAQKLLAYTHQTHNGCAITLSCLLQHAGIEVPDTYGAYALVHLLQDERKWRTVPAGQLLPGDVGTTCHGGILHPGSDHIYLVLKQISANELVVADNERIYPHLRSVNGIGDSVTPSSMFLRAV